MTIQNRLKQLEKARSDKTPAKIFVYYFDETNGYSKLWNGPYFATFEQLANAEGWVIQPNDTVINVTYASQ